MSYDPSTYNSDTKQMQEMFITLGYLPEFNEKGKSNADGLYGSRTAKAVEAFKAKYGLSGGSDVGDTTWMYLERDYKVKQAEIDRDNGQHYGYNERLMAASVEFNARRDKLFKKESNVEEPTKKIPVQDPNPNKTESDSSQLIEQICFPQIGGPRFEPAILDSSDKNVVPQGSQNIQQGTGDHLSQYNQINDMAQNVLAWMNENDKSVNDKTINTIYTQIYLWELGYGLGSIGPYKNGVDGDYGNATKAALLKFQLDCQNGKYGEQYKNIQLTIQSSVVKGKTVYSGSISTETFQALIKTAGIKIEEREKEWKNIIESSGSILDKDKYELADPRYYLTYHNSWQRNIDPVFEGRLSAFARDNKVMLFIGSGYRSYEEQVRLYKKNGGYQDKNGNWTGAKNKKVARPGNSFHNFGEAIDISWNGEESSQWVRELYGNTEPTNKQTELIKYGIFKPLTTGNGVSPINVEEWHIQPIETEGIYNVQGRKKFYDAYIK